VLRSSVGKRSSFDNWTRTRIVTRAVFLDITVVCGEPFIDPMGQCQLQDLDAARELAGATIEPSDAMLIYMSREEYEATGVAVEPHSSCAPGRPGIGEDGARWLGANPVAAVCWGFADGHIGGSRTAYVPLLIRAVGLALVDNCDLRRVRSALSTREPKTAMLVVAPLAMRGATASPVNPLLLV
jgi:kynurenine formamidase